MEQIATLFWEQDRESSSMKKEKVFLKENIVISFSRGVLCFLCPFAVYYLRYGVRPLFTMSRISLVDGKRAG
jgi:hypothetical protein